MRVRGNAYQVMEKYLAMARDASAAGDRIAMENYLQHAEHYYRIMAAQQAQMQQYQQQQALQQQNNGQNRGPSAPGDQPFPQQPQNQSAASFSLSENEEEGEEETAE